jgi:trans-o-hydroxybenzylidenepyruvate hydratase-aldolase
LVHGRCGAAGGDKTSLRESCPWRLLKQSFSGSLVMMNANEIRGLYAIIPTPAKAGAERLAAKNTVDLDETARVVNKLISDGCDGLIALGTTGECATLSQEDYQAFVGCVMETIGKRIPVFIGTSALGGHEVVKRMEIVRDCGAEGTLLGLPMWQPMTVKDAVNFYREIGQLFPEIAVMVYANQRAFRFSFPDEFWEGIVRNAPTVTSAKYAKPKDLKRFLSIAGGRINAIPNEMTIEHFFEVSPETTTACWATAASMGPKPAIELMNAVTRHDATAVKHISSVLAWANEPIAPIIADPEVFAFYNIQLEKVRIDAAGYCNAGPMRPPYGAMPEDFTQGAKECGRRWAILSEKIASGTRMQDFQPN